MVGTHPDFSVELDEPAGRDAGGLSGVFAIESIDRGGAPEVALVPVLAGLVDITRELAFTRAAEALALVEAMRVLEARIRPQHQADEALRPAPVDDRVDECLSEPLAPQVRAQVEAVKLGSPRVHAVDANRPHHALAVADDEERAARRLVAIPAKEIWHLDGRVPDPAVFREHETDELDDAGRVDSGRRFDPHGCSTAAPLFSGPIGLPIRRLHVLEKCMPFRGRFRIESSAESGKPLEYETGRAPFVSCPASGCVHRILL